MKKEAQDKALEMFLTSGGRATNRAIATAVNVNPLTIGRWKREKAWDQELKEYEARQTKETAPVVIRKKGQLQRALQLFLEAGGRITNKDLADKVKVSAATISAWKKQEKWEEQLAALPPMAEPTPPTEREEEPAPALAPPEEVTEVDVGELAAPEQIIAMNERIDALLNRDYLSAGELADLAEAKCDLLEAVETWLAIVQQVQDMRFED
jgi:transposase-like protein